MALEITEIICGTIFAIMVLLVLVGAHHRRHPVNLARLADPTPNEFDRDLNIPSWLNEVTK